MRQPSHVRSCCGLTLIELLVVIAIISFIAGLSVIIGPVLEQAHDAATRMSAIPSLRDLGADLQDRATAVDDLLAETLDEMWRILLAREVNPPVIDSLIRQCDREVDDLSRLLQAMHEIRPSLRTAEERLALNDGIRSASSLRWIMSRLAALLSLLQASASPGAMRIAPAV